MKYSTLLFVFLALIYVSCSPKVIDRWHLHRSLKLNCKNKQQKANEHFEKIEWTGDSTENQKLFFKLLYAEDFNGRLGLLTPKSISKIDSISSLDELQRLNNRAKQNYLLLKNRHSYFEKKYCIKLEDFDSLSKWLDIQEEELIWIDDSLKQAEIDSIATAQANAYFEKTLNESVDLVNEFKNSPYTKNVQQASKNKALIRMEVTQSDSIIVYDLEVSVFGEGLNKGVYYNKDSYLFLWNAFNRIANEHNGERKNVRVFGKADSYKEGATYPQKNKSYGTVSRQNVSVTRISKLDSITLIENINVDKNDELSGVELALLRANMPYSIAKDITGRIPDAVFVTDYNDSSNKKGFQYRTSGFIITVYLDKLSGLSTKQREDMEYYNKEKYSYGFKTTKNGDLDVFGGLIPEE